MISLYFYTMPALYIMHNVTVVFLAILSIAKYNAPVVLLNQQQTNRNTPEAPTRDEPSAGADREKEESGAKEGRKKHE